MAAARAGAVGVPTSRDGVALVAGGGSAQAELYGFATLKTDKDDYAPGEIVTFTGSGWQPGETVTLTISEDADSHNDFEFTAVADEFGNIVNREFYPREDDTYHHMGMRFYAMAKGIASEAQTTFTDGGTLTITFAGNGSGSVSGTAQVTSLATSPAAPARATQLFPHLHVQRQRGLDCHGRVRLDVRGLGWCVLGLRNLHCQDGWQQVGYGELQKDGARRRRSSPGGAGGHHLRHGAERDAAERDGERAGTFVYTPAAGGAERRRGQSCR